MRAIYWESGGCCCESPSLVGNISCTRVVHKISLLFLTGSRLTLLPLNAHFLIAIFSPPLKTSQKCQNSPSSCKRPCWLLETCSGGDGKGAVSENKGGIGWVLMVFLFCYNTLFLRWLLLRWARGSGLGWGFGGVNGACRVC